MRAQAPEEETDYTRTNVGAGEQARCGAGAFKTQALLVEGDSVHALDAPLERGKRSASLSKDYVSDENVTQR